jgi:hypothetical protein
MTSCGGGIQRAGEGMRLGGSENVEGDVHVVEEVKDRDSLLLDQGVDACV